MLRRERCTYKSNFAASTFGGCLHCKFSKSNVFCAMFLGQLDLISGVGVGVDATYGRVSLLLSIVRIQTMLPL